MLLLLPALALAEPAELSVWHSYRGAEREALEQVLADYDAAHPELKVVPLAVPTESFASKLEAAAPRGNGPELFIAASERIGSWSASGIASLKAFSMGWLNVIRRSVPMRSRIWRTRSSEGRDLTTMR